MDTNLQNKIILITGSTDGIGKQTAFELAKMGATILLHGRNQLIGEAVLTEIIKVIGNKNIEFFNADLSNLQQIRQLAEQIKLKYNRLNVLINNAGVFLNDRLLTEDGFEMTLTVNHLAHFLLTHLLLDLLQNGTPSRIITVSSIAHQNARFDFNNLNGEKNYDGYGAYSLSKLANILFTYELSEKLKGTGITANCLHPGVITTKLLYTGFGTTGASLIEGAETSVYLASSPEVENISGKYFVKKKQSRSSPSTYDIKLRREFWKVSEKLSGIKHS